MPKFAAQIDTSKIPIKSLIAEASGTAPSGPANGHLWTDTTATPIVKYWDGSAWIRMNGADIPNDTITDVKIAAAAGISLSKLATNPLARANHTGTQAASTISDFDTQVRLSRLDQMAAPTAAVSLNGQKITNLADPTLATDAASKQYVDSARAGIAGVKDPVRVASQANITIATPGAAIDGVTLSNGDRVLLAGQGTGTQNGIYVFNGAASAMTRATDADAAGEIQDGTLVAVSEGTYAGSQYIQTAAPSGAPGSWTMTWTVYNTAGSSYSAGAGLALSGSTFNVQAADGSITVNADDITVGNVPLTKGGTGGTSAATARANLVAVTGYAANAPALSAGVAANITHSLGTNDVQVAVWEIAGGARVYLDEAIVDTNTISLKADVAYGAGTLRVVVQARA
jgi:hypothetical protein